MLYNIRKKNRIKFFVESQKIFNFKPDIPTCVIFFCNLYIFLIYINAYDVHTSNAKRYAYISCMTTNIQDLT